MIRSSNDAPRALFRWGFYFSLLFFWYGTLFPFQFDFSQQEISKAWSQAGSLPYWDTERGRIPSLPDMLSNVLLTLPLGFFGVLHRSRSGRASKVWKWWALGLALGLSAEILQLAIPARSSDITDALNNSLGTLMGAILARMAGSRLCQFLEGTAADREHTYLWITLGTLTAIMLGPFDFSLSLSGIISDLRMLQTNPWELGAPIGDGWIQMAGFALLAALAARISRSGRFMGLSRLRAALAVVLLLPLALECSQLLVESHAPSLRDLAMEVAGATAGWLVGAFVPALARPFTGFLLLNLALAASGLSPYHFVTWQGRSSFEWTPFIEYYQRTTASALYDAMMGLLGFGLVGGLLQLSCPRCRRGLIAAYAMALAGLIEFAQLLLPSRTADTTDILIAGLGAWIGATICAGIEGFMDKYRENCP